MMSQSMLSEMLSWLNSMELYQLLAVSLMFGVSVTLVLGALSLYVTEARLAEKNKVKFADEDGVPYFIRADDKSIGL